MWQFLSFFHLIKILYCTAPRVVYIIHVWWLLFQFYYFSVCDCNSNVFPIDSPEAVCISYFDFLWKEKDPMLIRSVCHCVVSVVPIMAMRWVVVAMVLNANDDETVRLISSEPFWFPAIIVNDLGVVEGFRVAGNVSGSTISVSRLLARDECVSEVFAYGVAQYSHVQSSISARYCIHRRRRQLPQVMSAPVCNVCGV